MSTLFPTTRLYLNGTFKLYRPLNWSTASILFISFYLFYPLRLSSSEIKNTQASSPRRGLAGSQPQWSFSNVIERYLTWLDSFCCCYCKKSKPLNCRWQFLPLLQFLVDQFPIDSKHFQTCFRLWDFDFWKLKLNEIEVEAKFENFFRPTQPIFILPSNTVRWANVLTSSAKSVHLTMPLRFIKRSFFTLSKIFRAICRLATFGL